jgi:hypothetical protein
MECEDVRAFLSEYMDDVLDRKTKGLVDEHLLTCRACEKELTSLKAVSKEIGSLKPVQPPKDFLDQLHRRMERRSRISKVLGRFFHPLRVKIPLQFAGAAVVAVLLFLVVRVQHPAYILRPAPSSQISKQQKVLQETIPPEPEEPQKPGAPGRVQKNAAELQAGKREASDEAMPQHGVLTDKGVEYKVEKAEPAPRMKQTIVRPESRKPLELSLRLHGDLRSKTYASGLPGEARAPENQKQTTLAAKPATADLEKQQDKDRSLVIIEEAIRSFDGKILSVESSKDVEHPQFVVAEIPAKSLNALLGKLGELGELEGPARVSSERQAEGAVPLRIKVLPLR